MYAEWRASGQAPPSLCCLQTDPLDSPVKGGRTGCLAVSGLLFQELLFSLPWNVEHSVAGSGGTPASQSSRWGWRRWGAQPRKPPLCYPSSFQFGFELQPAWQGPGARGDWGVGRPNRKDLVPSAPCPCFHSAKALLKARHGNLELPAPGSPASLTNPHFLAQTLTSYTCPVSGFLEIDVLFLLTPGPRDPSSLSRA